MLDFRGTCTSHAVTAVSLGSALILFTSLFLGVFGLGSTSEVLLARLAGGFLLALGATLFAVRETDDPRLQRITVAGNGTCDVVLTVVVALAAPGLGVSGWVLAALFGVNALSWLVLIPSTRS